MKAPKEYNTYVIFGETEEQDKMFKNLGETLKWMRANDKRGEIVHGFRGKKFGHGRPTNNYRLVGSELTIMERCYNPGCTAVDYFENGYCESCIISLKIPTEHIKVVSNESEDKTERTDGEYVYA